MSLAFSTVRFNNHPERSSFNYRHRAKQLPLIDESSKAVGFSKSNNNMNYVYFILGFRKRYSAIESRSTKDTEVVARF